jgi:hypothetical protein
MKTQSVQRENNPGAAPGLEHDELIELSSEAGQGSLTCIDYGPALGPRE